MARTIFDSPQNPLVRFQPVIRQDEPENITWRVRAKDCGVYSLNVFAEAENATPASRDFELKIPCVEIVESEINQTLSVGNLEITLTSAGEDSYKEPGFGASETRYYRAYVRVFNTGTAGKETIHIQLSDNLGNSYSPDFGMLMPLDIRMFGKEPDIYPRVIREGYVIFPEISKDADTIRLTFSLDSTGEQAVFEFENRKRAI